jgi:hypothetical protein
LADPVTDACDRKSSNVRCHFRLGIRGDGGADRSDLNNYTAGYIADQQSCRVAAAGSIGSAARIHCHRAFSALTSGANGECQVESETGS